MLRTTLGQLLVNESLPEQLRNYDRVLDKKGVKSLLQDVADNHPEQYRTIAKKLSDVGRDASFTTGGYSFGLGSLRQSLAARKMRQDLTTQLRGIYASNDPDELKEQKILLTVGGFQKKLSKDVMDESLAEQNPLALQALSGARGNASNLNSLRGADLLYTDHRGRAMPIPVTRSYAMGLRPYEYFAGAFGARKGVIDLKAATQDAGFFAKQLVQAAHRLLVSQNDDEKEYDESNPRGYPVDTTDNDTEGALLAHPAGDYKRNTVLTPKILKELRANGVKQILVRSPTVGGPADGGVYARDVGVRERGGIAPLGDYVGIAGAQALAEPVTQAQISSKHSGGVAGASAGAISGFKYINCLAIDTQVRMADSTIKLIGDIVVGDWVMGSDITGRTFPVRVTNVFDNGLQPCHQHRFRVGRSDDIRTLVGTNEHKILSQRRRPISAGGWELPNKRRVGEVTSYPYAAVLVQSRDDVGMRHEPFALLAGLLLGDGCCTVSVEVPELACCDASQMEDLAPMLTALNLKATDAGDGKKYRLSVLKKSLDTSHARGGRWKRNHLRTWLEQHGIWGTYTPDKVIPAEVDTWNNSSVAELIGGLIVTDGCVYQHNGEKPGFYFVSTSRKLVEKTKELLEQRFGIYGGEIRTLPAETNEKAVLDAYRFDVASADALRRTFEHIPLYGIKRRKLAAWIHAAVSQRDSYSGRATRQKSESVGVIPTRDIEVDHPDHLFVLANGLVVSNSLVQVPKIFPGGAAHAQLDGRVAGVRAAPQGGQFITIGDQDHYAPHGSELQVKAGDTVEAGDVLTDGTPNPAEIVKHKGIGEGRRYFVDAFRKALSDSSTYGNRRNIELLARGLVNHVRLTDEMEDGVQGDVVPYQLLESQYKPRAGHTIVKPEHSVGQYLERPVLHYTIGTRVQPSMLPKFKQYGVGSVYTHRDPPPFEPEMVRGMANAANDPDWMTRMLGSYQKSSLLDAVHTGAVSDEAGSSFVPALARGENFGRAGLTKGWTSPKP